MSGLKGFSPGVRRLIKERAGRAEDVCCHAFAESHRTEAMERGWLISQHRKILPSDVPVRLHDGWYLLGDNGDKVQIPDRRVA